MRHQTSKIAAALAVTLSVAPLTSAQMLVDFATLGQDHDQLKLERETAQQLIKPLGPFGRKKNLMSPLRPLKNGVASCDPKVKQNSGYIPFTSQGSDKAYFFWMFESRSEPSKDPFVIWLTGGPGCSSQLALLVENGPCKVSKSANFATGKTMEEKYTFTNNPHSWNNKATVMWVDQPAGTGFSEGSYDHDEDGVGEDFYAFLQGFFDKFPQYRGLDFYVTGESYAGHYVPAISRHIYDQNKDSNNEKINLKGMAIGNGLTNPYEQYQWYPEMAYDGGKSRGGSLEKGVITNPIAQTLMKAALGACKSQIAGCDNNSTRDCMGAFLVCNYGETVPYQVTGMNVYDMREKCQVPPLCYDFSVETDFFNDEDVQKQLGIIDHNGGKTEKWDSCNMLVNTYFRADFMKSYHHTIPDMLEDGVKVLVYAGDVDYICNWLGNKAWVTKSLEWSGAKEFAAAEDKAWGNSEGRWRNYKNLSFLQIYQAGHMVPLNQPVAAEKLLNEFIAMPAYNMKENHNESTGSAAASLKTEMMYV